MSSNRRQFLLAASTLSLLAFGLVGCGPKGDAPAEVGKPVSVRLAFFPNVTHAAALVGTADGSFQKALGTEVKLEERVFTAGPAEIEALFAGEVDLGYIGPGPALNGYLKSNGEALRIVAGAASGGTALVAREGVEIHDIKDLAGKKVAVPQKGGTQDLSLRHAIQEAGLTPKEKGGTVDVLDFAPADTLTQFQQKQLDAAWVPEPWVARLEKDAGAKVVFDERDRWAGKKFATAVVVVRAAFLKEHPDLVEKFLTAHLAAVARLQKEPKAVEPLIAERIKSLNSGKAIPDDILTTALSRTDFTADTLSESVLTFADWSKQLGYLREDRTALTNLFDEKPLIAARRAAEKSPEQQAKK